LNEFLEKNNIESIETDLGEYIQQLDGEAPYHIVTPAMHKSKEDVARVFHEHLNTPIDLTPEQLTLVARNKLRQKYLDAAKYGKDKTDKPTESEKTKAIRDNIYANASTASGKGIIDNLFKLKGVVNNWQRVSGNPTLLIRKGTCVIEKFDVAGKSPEQLKAQFEQY
jgi:hypothetical protein